jgi:acyl-CoA synthetase (AMP-forming)/AMP-acid ligase II
MAFTAGDVQQKIIELTELVDDHLPQNASGKLFKRKIRDKYIEAMLA